MKHLMTHHRLFLEAVPCSGKILLQTELAEVYVRCIELLPLTSSQNPD